MRRDIDAISDLHRRVKEIECLLRCNNDSSRFCSAQHRRVFFCFFSFSKR